MGRSMVGSVRRRERREGRSTEREAREEKDKEYQEEHVYCRGS